MVPSLTASVGVRYDLNEAVFELTGGWVGSQFLVGDEGNDALGKLDGYTLLHTSVEREFGGVLFYLRVSNVLGADYRSFGILSENVRGTIRWGGAVPDARPPEAASGRDADSLAGVSVFPLTPKEPRSPRIARSVL